ncbi:hypothetical protein Mgra_00007287, partial [Meloidogyne graminicola]
MKQNFNYSSNKPSKNNFLYIHPTKLLFSPLLTFVFILTCLLLININNIEATKKRLCGKRLTSELWRVCTKQGAKGPCIHATKKRLCGKRLTSELWRVCTKQGAKGPCIHGVEKRKETTQKKIFFKQQQSLNKLNLWNIRYKIIKKSLSDKLIINDNNYLLKKRQDLNIILERNKRKGIVDQCCKGEGCDEALQRRRRKEIRKIK